MHAGASLVQVPRTRDASHGSAREALPELPHATLVDPVELPVCDLSQRFVRVLARRDDGFVEFAFSIGWPELSVELMLPVRDFDAFCRAHAVRLLTD